jgi:hypothetical protein
MSGKRNLGPITRNKEGGRLGKISVYLEWMLIAKEL